MFTLERMGTLATIAGLVWAGSAGNMALAGPLTSGLKITVNGQGPFDGVERGAVPDTYRFTIPRKGMLKNLAWRSPIPCTTVPESKEGDVAAVVIANTAGLIKLQAG